MRTRSVSRAIGRRHFVDAGLALLALVLGALLLLSRHDQVWTIAASIFLMLFGVQFFLVAALPVRTRDSISVGGGLIFPRQRLEPGELVEREIAEVHASVEVRRGRLLLTNRRMIYLPARSFVFGTDAVDEIERRVIADVSVERRNAAAWLRDGAVVREETGEAHAFFPTGHVLG